MGTMRSCLKPIKQKMGIFLNIDLLYWCISRFQTLGFMYHYIYSLFHPEYLQTQDSTDEPSTDITELSLGF